MLDAICAESAKCVNWLAMLGEPRTPGTRGRGSPLRGQFVGSLTKEETKQSRFDYHLGVRIDVGWLT